MRRLLQLVVHECLHIPWLKNLDPWTIRHEYGIHFEVDHHLDAKSATAVLGILFDYLLRRMNGLGPNVVALLRIRPKKRCALVWC